MAPQQPRFSRRFLTILIFITSFAIALLSQIDEPEDDQQPESAKPSQQQLD